MPKIIAFSGKSNSGKTTLICKIAEILRNNGKSVAIIKHDPKDKAEFDTQGKNEGKDSYKFSCVAQNVAVISPRKSVIFGFCTQPDSAYELREFSRVLEFFSACDYVLIEGLRYLPYKRIIVAREDLDCAYLDYGVAIAMDRKLRESTDVATLKNLKVLDLNNPQEIVEFIDKEC
ncbi:molybdopterin-guanine dinucleotide biosynthesis protein B [uncultured Helicobacter sp.]|uniref:molybdopterin-guanine dinucleotide biosynthesis protein B n=1 Tax=uncultured Helicobacter sp. TaxID=175537 RepID=UPI00374F0A81